MGAKPVHEDRRTNRMRTVSVASVAANPQGVEGLPESVLEALDELAGAAKEGLLALSVGVGRGVLHELIEAEVDEVVGPKAKHNPDRTALRHGHDDGEVTLGARRVRVSRPRARTPHGGREVELATYAHFAARARLSGVVLERMLAGVSTRRYARTGERSARTSRRSRARRASRPCRAGSSRARART